jgi:Fe-S-cluster containining protein
VPDEHLLDAGVFSEWLAGMQAAIRGEAESDVPCGSCTACCRSSHFVHIEPDETGALTRIPVALQFPAPRLPPGNVLMGYDEHGHCPMLTDTGCSIYEDRPRTCRTYDCRLFAAAGVTLEEAEKAEINERVAQWRFRYPAPADREREAAVRAAAAYMWEHGEPGPGYVIPVNVTNVAVRAVELYEQFLEAPERG